MNTNTETQEIDMFEHIDQLPEEVQNILQNFGECETYDHCEMLLDELEPYGYTFDYYLDAVPYNLRKI